MQLYIIRHAQSTNNALTDQRERVSDPLLTDIAHEQAQRVAEYLANGVSSTSRVNSSPEATGSYTQQGFGIDRLYCSAMWRALQTAAPIAEALDLKPQVWLDIHEHGGIFLDNFDGQGPVGYPGKTRSEILEQFPHCQLPEEITEDGWWRGGYEDWPACYGRAIKVARQLLGWAEREERIAMVTHGGFIDALIKALFGQLPNPYIYYHHNNTAITRLDFYGDGRIGLRYLNRVEHLLPELVT